MSYLGPQAATGGPVPGDPTRTTIVLVDFDGNLQTLTVTYSERTALWENMWTSAGARGDFFAWRGHDKAHFPGTAGSYEQALNALTAMRSSG